MRGKPATICKASLRNDRRRERGVCATGACLPTRAPPRECSKHAFDAVTRSPLSDFPNPSRLPFGTGKKSLDKNTPI